MPFLRYFSNSEEGQSSDPKAVEVTNDELALPKSLDEDGEADAMTRAIDKLKPTLAKITFGSLVGYCSGVATKKIGKALAICAGLGFMVVQTAVYSGYVDVDWKKVQDDVKNKVDTNKDGALNSEDVKTYWKKVKEILTKNVPNAGGFSLGFLYGVTYA